MNPEVVAWLASAEGQAEVERARDLTGDALARSAALRRDGLDAAQAAGVLEQADLLARAVAGGVLVPDGGSSATDADDPVPLPLPLLTRDGLEQATRAVVADRRAGLFAATGARVVVDVTAGLGLDAAAVVRAGLRSIAVERDPVVAALLAHNLATTPVDTGELPHDLATAPVDAGDLARDFGATSVGADGVASDEDDDGHVDRAAFVEGGIGREPHATVFVGDATDVIDHLLASIGPQEVVFVDPARRVAGRRTADGARALPERDPEQWSPPLSWVVDLARRHPRVVAKVNPGFAHTRVPDGWHAEWVSVDGSAVETTLWSFDAIPHRQVVIVRDDVVHAFSADRCGAHTVGAKDGTDTQPVGTHAATAIRAASTRTRLAGERSYAHADASSEAATDTVLPAYLLEPDETFGASGLIDALAASLGARRVGDGMWLTTATAVESPFARIWHVIAELPAGTKALRQALVAKGIGNVTVKSRGAGLDAGVVRRDLKLTKGVPGTIVMLREAGGLRAYLVERA